MTALRHSADGLLPTRTYLEVSTAKVGLDLHKEKTKRHVEACLSLCLTIFWLSVRPSFRWSVRPLIHVSMSLNHATKEL